jgi:hypothetical protein
MAKRAATVYSADISYGDIPIRSGHWADRLPEIDKDLAVLLNYFAENSTPPPSATTAVQKHLIQTLRPFIPAAHTAPASFQSGSDLALTIHTPEFVAEAILWYRHVNQGERWLSTPMQKDANTHSAAIPGAYTHSPYPLQYYFELHTADAATLHPPFNPTLSNNPYYALMPAT